MTAEVRYYREAEHTTDTALLAGLLSAAEQLVAETANGGTHFQNFVKFAARTSIPGQIVVDAFDVIVNEDRSTATIAGSVVDLTAAALAAAAISALGSGAIVSVAVAFGTGFAYSEWLEPIVDETIDDLAGTADREFELLSSDGNLLGGAFYRDGVGSLSAGDAIRNLLVHAINGEFGPDFHLSAGMQIRSLSGQSQSEVSRYDLVEGSVLEEIAQATGDTLSDFLSRSAFNDAAGSHVSNTSQYLDHGGEQWLFLNDTATIAVNVGGSAHHQRVIGFGADAIEVEGQSLTGGLTSTSTPRLVIGGNSDENLFGGTSDDWIFGGGGSDTLHGLGGDDYLRADDQSGEIGTTADGLFGGVGDDVLIGSLGGNFLSGGENADIVLALDGDDTIIGDKGADVLIGGNGHDEVTYYGSQHGLEVTISDSDTQLSGVNPELANFFAITNLSGFIEVQDGNNDPISGSGFDYDYLYQIEKIVGSDNSDSLHVHDLGASELDHLQFVDLRSRGDGAGDQLILTSINDDLVLDLRSSLFQEISSSEGSLTVSSANIVHTGGGDDVILAGGYVHDFGDGVSAKALEVHAGGGNDDITLGAKGTVVYTGSGNDIITLAGEAHLVDLDSNDSIFLAGDKLTGALKSTTSETPWAGGKGVRMGFNHLGDLVIEDNAGRKTFVSDADVGPYASNRTAGLFVAEREVSFTRLLDPSVPKGWWTDFWKNQLLASVSAMSTAVNWDHVDPLVFDLNGNGLELIASSSEGPRFDIDGDGFAEPTGWVLSGDGFLALDADGSGTIDDISELFGSPTQSGFDELGTHDLNLDGVIDANDAVFADLRIWEDLDRDAVTDAGELTTLAERGITAISLTTQAPAVTEIARNTVAAEASFTRSDGSTGTIADVNFRLDNYDSTYLGDTTVSAAAALEANVRGHGTLTDLHVAMTQDPALLATVQSVMPTLTTPNLDALVAAVTPILTAWAAPDTATRPDIPLLVSVDAKGNRTGVDDFGVPLAGGGWGLASGAPVRDAQGVIVAAPEFADVVAHFNAVGGAEYRLLDGAHLGFVERHIGETIPIDSVTPGNTAAMNALNSMLDFMLERLEVVTVRLAIQGPLGDTYFQGVDYDLASDKFQPNTDRQLIPTYEAIFANAPADAGAATAYLEGWKQILDVVIGDYERGESHLLNTYSFLFGNIVAAYESTGVALGIEAAAEALGVPSDIVVSGDGTLEGTSDKDIFYLDSGNEVARGGQDYDVYVVGRNFGQDVIDDVEPPLSHQEEDAVRFADIKSTEVTAVREGLELVISVDGTTDELRILRQFEGRLPGLFGGDFSDNTGVGEIIFADGVVWDRLDIARAVSHPLGGDETYIGTPTVDYLDGGAGNDHLEGGDDGDVYSFGRGWGHDTIEDNQGNILIDTPDFLGFGSGVAYDDISFHRAGNSDDLEIRIDDTGEAVRILGQFNATYPGAFEQQWFDRIELFVFENGSQYTWDGIIEKLVADAKTDGDDVIYGFSYEDRLDGGAGNDQLYGGNESDSYLFGLGSGDDRIQDQQDNILSGDDDRLVLTGALTQADVAFSRAGPSDDLVLTLTGSGETVTLVNQFKTTHTGVFGVRAFDRIEQVDFTDGTSLTWQAIQQLLLDLYSTGGDDTIHGFSYKETLDGGLGNDYLAGSADSDTYLFALGDGQDTIYDFMENVLYEDSDKIAFAAGIITADVTASRSGDDLILDIGAGGDRITVEKQFKTDNLGNRYYEIESFVFDDGTSWSTFDLREAILASAKTSGDDTIVGFFGEDTLDGGAGNDRLEGGDGGDHYLFDTGYGQDTIYDAQTSIFASTPDALVFGAGITTSDISLARSGTDLRDLIVTLDATGDQVTLVRQFAADTLGNRFNEVEQFRFDDGTVWTREDIQQQVLAAGATAGDDTLTGFSGTDILDGGAGNDRLEGGNGGDIYIFGRDYNLDLIYDSATSIFADHGDQVSFKSDIAVADVTLSRSGNNLIVDVAGGNDRLTIQDQFHADNLGNRMREVESLAFADGTVWARQDIQGILLTSSDGDDTLIGFYSADTLSGGLGNDWLEGRDGSDTYLFGLGDGQDTIKDVDVSIFAGSDDRVVFAAGITTDMVGLARDGNALVMTFEGTSDSLRVIDQFRHDFYRVESFEFADGTVWSYGDITSLMTQGTEGPDNITGFDIADTIYGLGGNDNINAGDGSDLVYGGDGADSLNGGDEGKDVIHGGAGNDRLWGNWDADTLYGDEGEDSLYGGWGWDKLYGGAGNDRIEGYKNNDHIEGGAGNDVLYGGDGDDALYGGAGDDYVSGDLGTDYNDGGAGVDTLSLSHVTSAMTVDLAAGTAGGETAVNFENFISGSGSDTITGNDLANHIRGGNGDDTIFGGGGDDWIAGEAGVDSIDGGAGSDTVDFYHLGVDLVIDLEAGTGLGTSGTPEQFTSIENAIGGSGDDHLIGGVGDNTLTGGLGDDQFLYDLGDGNDTLAERIGEGTTDRLVFGAGIATPDVTLGFGAGLGDWSLTLTDGSQITLAHQFDGDAVGVEFVDFDGGTRWDLLALYDESVNTAPTLDQGIADVAGDEDQPLSYAIPANAFQDANNRDVLTYTAALVGGAALPTWLAFDGQTFSGTPKNAAVGDHVIEVTATDRFGATATTSFTLTVNNMNDAPQAGPQIANVEAPAGDALSFVVPSDALTDVDVGDSLTLTATLANGDPLPAWLSFDGQTFTGTPTIAEIGILTVKLVATDLSAATGETTFQIDVVPAGGAPVVSGTDGNDNLVGTAFGEVMIGGLGDDTLAGGAGDDVYFYSLGDGNDAVRKGTGGLLADADRVDFGAGITAADLTLTHVGNDLSIAVAGGGSVLVENYFRVGRVSELRFSDGSSLGWTDVLDAVGNGTAGNDSQSGSSSSQWHMGLAGDDTLKSWDGYDVLIGGTGNDRLEGGKHGDRYVYDIGDGDDVIFERSYSTYSNYEWGDRLALGPGIRPEDLLVHRYADLEDISISFSGFAGSIFLDETLARGQYGIDDIEFADGTIWDLQDLVQKGIEQAATAGGENIIGSKGHDTIDGLAGDDTLNGWEGHDTIYAGAGNDLLVGHMHGDTYVYNIGDGDDILYERSYSTYSNYEWGDKLLFGAGITPDDLIYTRHADWNDITITFDGFAGSIFLDQTLERGQYGIDEVQFDDGTLWSLQDLVNASLAQLATEGDDYLVGSKGSESILGHGGDDILKGWDGYDVLIGGAGNDVLEGATHGDRYVYNVGDGDDIIYDYSSTYSNYELGDVLALGVGINPENLRISRDTTDLEDILLRFEGVGGSVLLNEHYHGGAYGIEEIQFGDGTVWSRTDLSSHLMFGGSGADTLTGTALGDYQDGGAGDDTLDGGGGHDVLEGDAGADTLTGGSGNDYLTGGADDVVFVFADGSGSDRVEDFTAGSSSGEVLDIAAFGFTDFAAVGAAMTQDGGDVVLQLDADDQIRLVGLTVAELQENDFII